MGTQVTPFVYCRPCSAAKILFNICCPTYEDVAKFVLCLVLEGHGFGGCPAAQHDFENKDLGYHSVGG